jgi:hypothetical protein
MTPEEYERRPEVKAAMRLVREHRELHTHSWRGFHNQLRKILNLPPEESVEGGWAVPVEFQYAQKRVAARWSRKDAFNQVVRPAIKSGKITLSGRFEQMALLEVLEELARLYPTLLLVDQTKPEEGPFPVKDVLEGIRLTIEQGEVPIELLSFLQTPHWIWGMEGLGFVSVWAMPTDGSTRLAFKEHEGGLPVGRPPFTR